MIKLQMLHISFRSRQLALSHKKSVDISVLLKDGGICLITVILISNCPTNSNNNRTSILFR